MIITLSTFGNEFLLAEIPYTSCTIPCVCPGIEKNLHVWPLVYRRTIELPHLTSKKSLVLECCDTSI